MVTEKEPGDEVEIVLYRDGEDITVNVTLGEYTSDNSSGNSNNFRINGNNNGSSGNGGNGGYGDFDIDDIFRYYFN